MSPAKHFFGLEDALERGDGFRRMNAAERLGGLDAQIRTGTGGQIAIDDVHESSQRFAISSDSDFFDDHGHYQRVDVIEQLQKNAAPAVRAAGGKLAHHAVLGGSRKTLDASRKKNFHGLRIELAEQAHHLHGFGSRAAAHGAAQVLHALFTQVGSEIGDVLGVVAEAGAIEAIGELLHGRLGQQLEYVGQADGGLADAQGLFHEFRDALLNAHFRAQRVGDAGTLSLDAGNQIQGLLHGPKMATRGGLLAQAHESSADQRLQLGILLDA